MQSESDGTEEFTANNTEKGPTVRMRDVLPFTARLSHKIEKGITSVPLFVFT